MVFEKVVSKIHSLRLQFFPTIRDEELIQIKMEQARAQPIQIS